MVIDDDKKDPKQNKILDVQTTPPINNQVPAVPAGIDPNIAALLAQLAEQSKVAMAREARLKKLEDEEDARKKAKDDQHRKNGSVSNKDHLDVQANCKHLKGGKFRKKNAVKDYGLSCHQFISGNMEMRCLVGCRMRWIPTDTKEWIIRDGRKLKNHTGLGWADVLRMMNEDSSNTGTKSETCIPMSPAQIADRQALMSAALVGDVVLDEEVNV